MKIYFSVKIDGNWFLVAEGYLVGSTLKYRLPLMSEWGTAQQFNWRIQLTPELNRLCWESMGSGLQSKALQRDPKIIERLYGAK